MGGFIMLISDIMPGAPISIELAVADATYEMPSSIVASKPGYILIAPFTLNGTVINLEDNKDMLFNVYTIDPSTRNRVVWKNVHLETITYKSSSFVSAYYKISTSSFASLSSTCDRRASNRITIDIPGYVTPNTESNPIPITIHDISDKGLSFKGSQELEFQLSNGYITLSDQANGKEFNLNFKFIKIRSTPVGEDIIYGCMVPSPSREYLTYVFLKKLESRMNSAKEDSEKAAILDAASVANTSIETSDNNKSSSDSGKGFHSTIGTSRNRLQ